MTQNVTIAVVGAGYVGLVSGVCLAEIGHDVTCIDRDAAKIDGLKNGVMPIYEIDLNDWVARNAAAKRLHFTTDLPTTVKNADAVFIAVGTPTAPDGISVDLTAVDAVVRALAPHLKKNAVVVTKSTVPVKTNAHIENIIRAENPHAVFDICSNPEFLREGTAIADFMNADRIVVGVRSQHAQNIMEKIYAPLIARGVSFMATTPESAELIKYASNAFLATKIAFINEVADIAEATGGNITDIARGVGLDTRIGPKFLNAGPGFGGSCFPKDTRGFAHMAQNAKCPSTIVNAVIASNDARKKSMATRVINALGGNVSGKTIAVWGVTFKPGTDDMRESVSLDILPALVAAGATIRAADPGVTDHGRAQLPRETHWCADAPDTAHGADAVVVVTEWPEFAEVDLAAIKHAMRGSVIVDLRNHLNAEIAVAAGFDYIPIGRAANLKNTSKRNVA